MTVKELIEALSKLDMDLEVRLPLRDNRHHAADRLTEIEVSRIDEKNNINDGWRLMYISEAQYSHCIENPFSPEQLSSFIERWKNKAVLLWP